MLVVPCSGLLWWGCLTGLCQFWPSLFPWRRPHLLDPEEASWALSTTASTEIKAQRIWPTCTFTLKWNDLAMRCCLCSCRKHIHCSTSPQLVHVSVRMTISLSQATITEEVKGRDPTVTRRGVSGKRSHNPTWSVWKTCIAEVWWNWRR